MPTLDMFAAIRSSEEFSSAEAYSSSMSEDGETFERGIEEPFGWFFISCGLLAFVANTLVLIATLRYIRYKNILFLIITNFALIDIFKGLCAIYMGGVLVSVLGEKDKSTYFVTFKMLQVSVFMLNVGNIASVFNLLLATINEFLYIKLPLGYKKMVTCKKVGVAIVCSWCLSIAFSLGKSFYRSSPAAGATDVLVSENYTAGGDVIRSSRDKSAESREAANGTNHSNKLSANESEALLVKMFGDFREKPEIIYREGNRSSLDVYTLILLSCLMLCLIIVMSIYVSLYRIMKASKEFQRGGSSTKLSTAGYQPTPRRLSQFRFPPLTPSASAPQTPRFPEFSFALEDEDERLSGIMPLPTIRKISGNKRESEVSSGSESTRKTSLPLQRNYSNGNRLSEHGTASRQSSNGSGVIISAFDRRKQLLSLTFSRSLQGMPQSVDYGRKHSTTSCAFSKRFKGVVVILLVCTLYTVYLSIYFALQVLHMMNIRWGIAQNLLMRQYTVNFVLRALYVFHAALNPFILFRIRTFRRGCCKLWFGVKSAFWRLLAGGGCLGDDAGPKKLIVKRARKEVDYYRQWVMSGNNQASPQRCCIASATENMGQLV